MKLSLDKKIIKDYKSPAQKARLLTENWVSDQIFCPNCGHLKINQYPNNKPAVDFYCSGCKENFELKGKQNTIGAKVVDGAYRTMMERLQSRENPNLFLFTYDFEKLEVLDFLVVPKHFFTPKIIERRKPLGPKAVRAGWVGCNISLLNLPESGKIFFVKNQIIESKEKVLSEWKKTLFLKDENEISEKGWLLDIMKCLDKLGKKEFTINDVYSFEEYLSRLHPENKHIKDKIRQQLQTLRNKNYLDFISKGLYRLK